MEKRAGDGSRVPLGEVESHQPKSAAQPTKIPNAPAGEYVIVEYETDSERASRMIETVTLQQCSYGCNRGAAKVSPAAAGSAELKHAFTPR